MEVELSLANMVGGDKVKNCGEDKVEVLACNGIQLTGGNEMVDVNDGGVRIAHDSNGEVEGGQVRRNKNGRRHQKTSINVRPISSHDLSVLLDAAI